MNDIAEGLTPAVRTHLRDWGIAVEVTRPDRSPADTDEGIDAIVTLSRAGSSARYAVVAKNSMTLSALTARTLPSSQHPLLIVGNRISRRSATALREAGIQFVDGLGNAFISFGNVLIEVQGRTAPGSSTSSAGDTAAGRVSRRTCSALADHRSSSPCSPGRSSPRQGSATSHVAPASPSGKHTTP